MPGKGFFLPKHLPGGTYCLTSALSQDRTLKSKYMSLGAVFFPFRNSGELECVDGLYGLARLCQLLGFHLTLSLEHLLKAFVSHTDRLCSAVRRSLGLGPYPGLSTVYLPV